MQSHGDQGDLLVTSVAGLQSELMNYANGSVFSVVVL